jgi:hypothetical protein
MTAQLVTIEKATTASLDEVLEILFPVRHRSLCPSTIQPLSAANRKTDHSPGLLALHLLPDVFPSLVIKRAPREGSRPQRLITPRVASSNYSAVAEMAALCAYSVPSRFNRLEMA